MGEGTVLIADDESAFRDLCTEWLREDYAIRTAADGDQALERLDESVDVVLLDRLMPGTDGRDVLREIRAREGDYRVVVVTAVDPDLDVAEMAFDEYLVKPVTEADVTDVVKRMLARSNYDARVRRYYALASRVATLRATHDASTLAESERYRALTERRDRAAADAAAVFGVLSSVAGFDVDEDEPETQ